MGTRGIRDISGTLGSIWEVSGKPLGSIFGASGNLGWLGSTWNLRGPFSIIKMGSNRRERPFYRRVAKVGRTKYRKTQGSSADAPSGRPGTHIAQP